MTNKAVNELIFSPPIRPNNKICDHPMDLWVLITDPKTNIRVADWCAVCGAFRHVYEDLKFSWVLPLLHKRIPK